ncbi:MAG TPA: hypothetical protein VFK05_24845 [Polyangiaceae bacterium]|nr:hypothetical protein [Polyangiaceae bacterium]
MAMAVVCLAVLINGCSGDPQATHSIPGCETHDVTPCDVRSAACEQSRFELAACLRGAVGGEPPPLTLMTEEQYIASINGSSEGRDRLTNRHYELALTWLGLAQQGSFDFVPATKESVASMVGTYRWRNRDLLIIDHGKPGDDVASNVVLVAAMIRALRDRDIQIGTWSTVVGIYDADSTWGADAMWFGEARFFSNRYQVVAEGRDPATVDEYAQIQAAIREDIAWIRSQPSTYVATNTRFPPNFGARAAYLAWHRGGAEAMNYLYGDKLITQQLMASETEEHPAPKLKYHARPRAPEEWDQDPIVTAFGAWGLYLSLGRNMDSDAAWSLALNWSGEQLFVYKAVAPSEDTALVWQLEMADEDSASALADALTSGIAGGQVQRAGTFVTLAVASGEHPLDWAFVSD